MFLFLYLALFSYQYFPTFFLFKRVVYYVIGKIFLPKSYLCETIYRSSHPEVFLGKSVLKICSNFTGEHPCRSDFNKVPLQRYWNRTSAWVFSCKFAAYFQNTFSQEHLWIAASVFARGKFCNCLLCYFQFSNYTQHFISNTMP